MAIEYTDVVAAFITSRLTGDSTMQSLIGTRVYDTDIPQANTEAERAAIYPCVVFNLQAAGPALYGNGDQIVWSPGDYQVFGLTESKSFTDLVPISTRITQLLHGANSALYGLFGGGYVNTCSFVHPIKAAQTDSGLSFRRLGGLFHVAARLSAS
jgi:hypothetical protein